MNALMPMPTVIPPGTTQGNWMWDGTQWICGPCSPPPCIPPFPNCPPPGFPPPGCPPWFSLPNSPPWYPGANAGVSFGNVAPVNITRGHFWWDGTTLWMFDGGAWVDTSGSPAPGQADAPSDSRTYGRLNGTWFRVVSAAGDTMTGPLVLSADPTLALGAVTKQYSDAHAGVQQLLPVYYTSSQTITIPNGAHQALVQMWGSTGGSGGVSNTNSLGTGAGGYLEKLLTGLVPGNTLIFAQGPAGAAGLANAAGGSGGVTTLSSGTQAIGTLTCNGSTGTGPLSTSPISLGGSATGGDINVLGQNGPYAPGGTSTTSTTPGAVTFFSRGAEGVYNSGSAPGNQGNPGGLKITWGIFSS